MTRSFRPRPAQAGVASSENGGCCDTDRRRTPPTVAAREIPLAQHTPAVEWATTTSRSPGSRVGGSHHLPGSRRSSGIRCSADRSQLRGQPGFYPSSLLIPSGGTCRERISCNNGHIKSIAIDLEPTSFLQNLCVMLQMIGHERLDEIVPVVIARLHAQVQLLSRRRGRGGEFFG